MNLAGVCVHVCHRRVAVARVRVFTSVYETNILLHNTSRHRGRRIYHIPLRIQKPPAYNTPCCWWVRRGILYFKWALPRRDSWKKNKIKTPNINLRLGQRRSLEQSSVCISSIIIITIIYVCVYIVLGCIARVQPVF